MFKEGKIDAANELKSKSIALKDKSSDIQRLHDETADSINSMLLLLPNLPQNRVQKGKSEADNIVVKEAGPAAQLTNEALPHWDLASKYKIIDFETGNKITGSGFPLYRGKGAKLQRALISWFLDKGDEAGYTEFIPPLMVNEDSGYGTGQLPDKEGQMYHVTVDNFYLIPTAEVPLTNI